MSESEKPFTVNDRRHFTPDGRVREEPEAPAGPDESAPEAEPVAPVSPEGPSTPAADPERDAEPKAPRASHADPQSSRSEGPGAQDAGPADLGQFLYSLGAQAGLLLSGQGLPEGADPGEALAGARSIISILEMLKEKTEGRRNDQESEILEGLLYELRMAYVERSRAGGS